MRISIRINVTAVVLVGVASVCSAQAYLAELPQAEPDRLYVVQSDITARNNGVVTISGRVALVDPDRGIVERVIDVGNKPDIGIIPGRGWLYLSSDVLASGGLVGRFAALDLHTRQPLWSHDEEPTRGMPTPYNSRMALSLDGALLYRYRRTITDSGVESSWLETTDARRNVRLPDRVPLSLCGGRAALHPVSSPASLFVVCGRSQDVRAVTVSPSGALQGEEAIVATLETRPQWEVPAQAFVHDGGRLFTVLQDDGTAITLGTISLRLVARGRLEALGDGSSASSTGLPALVVETTGRVYLHAFGPEKTPRLVVMASRDLTPIEVFETNRYFVSLAASLDGTKLYAVDGSRTSVIVLDAMTGEELETIEIEGGQVVYAVVAQ